VRVRIYIHVECMLIYVYMYICINTRAHSVSRLIISAKYLKKNLKFFLKGKKGKRFRQKLYDPKREITIKSIFEKFNFLSYVRLYPFFK